MNCIYCGSRDNLSRDHVPPKCLFRKPYPKDLYTVPACKKCNTNFSQDEEFFRLIMIGCFCHSKEGDQVFDGPISRSLDRKPSLEEKLFGSICIECNMIALSIDWNRIYSIAIKIAYGLEYLETGVSYNYDQNFNILFGEVDSGNSNVKFGPDFTYSKISIPTKGWEFTFFDSIRFSVTPVASS